MTDEERQRTMDFILRQQAQAAVAAQRNEEEHAKFTKSLKQIRKILAGAIWEARRDRRYLNERMAALANAQTRAGERHSHLDERMNALIDAQLRTEEALRSLAATTERNSVDIATLAKAGKTNVEDDGGVTPS